MADRPDFALLVGVEEILAEMVARGAHGGVCGGANLYPRLYVISLKRPRAEIESASGPCREP